LWGLQTQNSPPSSPQTTLKKFWESKSFGVINRLNFLTLPQLLQGCRSLSHKNINLMDECQLIFGGGSIVLQIKHAGA
jgi:hypothetical protein